jgi:hypothetical protein
MVRRRAVATADCHVKDTMSSVATMMFGGEGSAAPSSSEQVDGIGRCNLIALSSFDEACWAVGERSTGACVATSACRDCSIGLPTWVEQDWNKRFRYARSVWLCVANSVQRMCNGS